MMPSLPTAALLRADEARARARRWLTIARRWPTARRRGLYYARLALRDARQAQDLWRALNRLLLTPASPLP